MGLIVWHDSSTLLLSFVGHYENKNIAEENEIGKHFQVIFKLAKDHRIKLLEL